MSCIFTKKATTIDVMDISTKHVKASQVRAYIEKLYKDEGFQHICYRIENKNGLSRFVVYTLPGANEIIQYFKDRCPAMVEKECLELIALQSDGKEVGG